MEEIREIDFDTYFIYRSLSQLSKSKVMNKIIIILPLIFLVSTQEIYGQIEQSKSLVELDTLSIIISVDIREEDHSPLENSLKNKYELRLRQNDIDIGLEFKRFAFLDLTFNGGPVEIGGQVKGYAISYGLSLSQMAYLHDETLIYPTTWSNGGIMITSEGDLETKIRQVSEDVLDKFLNDYLSVNEGIQKTVSK